jgi:hypothetical protein
MPTADDKLRGLLALVVLVVVTSASVTSVLTRFHLGYLGGVTDEYFPLGAKLLINGTLGPAADEPSSLRQPGYVAFVAAVLAVAAPSPREVSGERFTREGQVAVMLSQALVLGLACALLTAFLAGRGLDPWISVSAGLVLGLNPFSVLWVGLMHYGIVHMATLVLAIVLTERAASQPGNAAIALAAGAAWAVSALVRPVVLAFPAVLAVALLLRRDGQARRHLRMCALLAAGMAAVIAPWALRNFRITGRVVAVSQNGWPALWAQTVMPLDQDPNRYAWFDIYKGPFQEVFGRATGRAGYDYLEHSRRSTEVDAAFRQDALRRLRDRPGVYAANVAGNLASLLTAEPMVMVASFLALQSRPDLDVPRPPGAGTVPQSWLLAGAVQPRVPAGLSWSMRALMGALEVAALAGAGLVAWRSRGWGTVALAALVCVCAAHALVFVHLMHFYLRLPFLALFAAEALDRLAAGRRLPALWAAALLVAGSAACLVAMHAASGRTLDP